MLNSSFGLLGLMVIFIFTASTGYPQEINPKERLPIWDRIALSDVNIYSGEGREQDESLPPVKKGTWARFIKRSAQYHTELVELESGEQCWVDAHGFYPTYYVVGTTDLVVQVLHGSGKKPTDAATWTQEVIAHPGDVVAVDRLSQALLGTWLVYTPDGSKSGFAPSNRLEPVGDPGEQ